MNGSLGYEYALRLAKRQGNWLVGSVLGFNLSRRVTIG